jgi:demethylmenaquinone methyltransferase/2-methoxy-6-polyprenyl-1,4-benzoquinol methylase
MPLRPLPLVRPLPLLRQYYDTEQGRTAFIRALFNRVAPEYEVVNRVLSLGLGRWYRRTALRQAGLCAGMRVLDVATGTGMMAREELRLVGAAGEVIGLDLSENMLLRAHHELGVECVQARAEALPILGGSVDFISMSYALRHAADLSGLFHEFFRVLRPAGTLLVLEFLRPAGPIGKFAAALYFRHLIPTLCGAWGLRSAREMLSYCWDTVDHCVTPGVIRNELAAAGFTKIVSETSMGVLVTYCARRPADGHGRPRQPCC